MRAQRPPGAAPVLDARAEQLPFDDGSFDAAMAILSDHHWDDHARGLAELRRVARRRVVLFNAQPHSIADSWLVRDYLHGFAGLVPDGYSLEQTLAALGGGRIEPVPIPHDCRDGFSTPTGVARTPTSTRACAPASPCSGCSIPPRSTRWSRELAADLDSGEWERRNASCSSWTSWNWAHRWSSPTSRPPAVVTIGRYVVEPP